MPGSLLVFVPIFGLMLGMATGCTWVGCIVAAFGLYLLGVDDQYQMGYDLLQLVGAGSWALHILAIDRFTKHAPGSSLPAVIRRLLDSGIFVSTMLQENPLVGPS